MEKPTFKNTVVMDQGLSDGETIEDTAEAAYFYGFNFFSLDNRVYKIHKDHDKFLAIATNKTMDDVPIS